MVHDSRSASYPGAAIASSYDFGSIDFFSTVLSGEGYVRTRATVPVRSMYRARYVPRVLEGRALLAVVCHGALRVARAVCAYGTCNSHVLLHRQRLIVEVLHGVAAETVSRRRRYRTWQGAFNVEQCVSVQMSSAVKLRTPSNETMASIERPSSSPSISVYWSRYAPRVFHRDANCNLAPSRSFGRWP